jgi:uncharacterized membrane protein
MRGARRLIILTNAESDQRYRLPMFGGLALTLLAALGCGLVAGVFFAFSTFVMKALARLPARDGIAAMQSINLTVLNPWFLGVFFGTGAACVLALICVGLRWDQPGAVYLLAGGMLSLVGTLLVTILCNVPRNEALARVEPAHGARLWAAYLTSWTAWNHFRTAASLAAAAAFSLALGD